MHVVDLAPVIGSVLSCILLTLALLFLIFDLPPSAMNQLKAENIPPTGMPAKQAAPQPSHSEHAYPRDIKLSVDLRDLKNEVEGEVLAEISSIFPGTTQFAESRARSYLCFTVKELPRARLPLTISGLPFTIEDEAGNGRGMLMRPSPPGNVSIELCDDIKGSQVSFQPVAFRAFADRVTQAMHELLPELQVIEFMLSTDRLMYIVLPDEIDIDAIRSKLPGRIAKCWTTYLNERDVHRPSKQQAQRAISPSTTNNIVDDFPYNVLRPGVVLCSPLVDGGTESFNTTSGVLVKDRHGNAFMTAASHGIGDHQKVYQKLPLSRRRLVGEAIFELTATDIALVKLQGGIDFDNQPFQEAGATLPAMTRLLGEVPDENIVLDSLVYMNSPFTGAMEGNVLMRSWKPDLTPPIHPVERTLRYATYDWIYLGQAHGEKPKLPDSICGSPIWDEYGRVLGFFRYYVEEGRFQGFYAAVRADELVRAGYTLAL